MDYNPQESLENTIDTMGTRTLGAPTRPCPLILQGTATSHNINLYTL